MSLRPSNETPSLFEILFPDSNVAKSLSTSRKKAYVLQDGLGPLLSDGLATKLKKLNWNFTIMFDETTAHQNRKQMDILSFWDLDENQVFAVYLTSIHFVRAKAVDITKIFLNLEEEECLPLSWSEDYAIFQ